MCTIDDAKVLNAILNPNTPFEEEEAPKKNESSMKLYQIIYSEIDDLFSYTTGDALSNGQIL